MYFKCIVFPSISFQIWSCLNHLHVGHVINTLDTVLLNQLLHDDMVSIINISSLAFFWFSDRIIALAVVVSIHSDSFQCNSGYLLKTYYFGMLVILSLHIILDIVIMVISTRGTITNATPRKRLPIFLYLKIAIFLPEVGWTILGTIWAFDESSDCDDRVVMTIKGAAILGWIILFGLIVSILIIFDTTGSRSGTVGIEDSEDVEASSAAKKLWELRSVLS